MASTKQEMEKETNKRIMKSYKNLAAVCIGWFLLVVSFGSLQGLVSSINHEDGLGFFSMACFYTGAIICPFSATVFRRWKTKQVLCVLTLAQIPLVLAYAMPRLYTVLPTAFIGGIAQSVAFSLTGAYLVWVSTTLSNAKGDTSSQYLSMAFGIYYMSVSFAPSIGGICSTFILSSNIGESVFQQHNTTENIKQSFLSNETINNITLICGPNFCPYQKAEVSQLEITNVVRFSLLGFYSLCMVAATLVFSFGMEERTSKKQEKQEKQNYSMSEVLRSTIHVIKQKRFLIVAPLIFYNGFQWAFVVGDIMKAFGGCVFGAETIGTFVATYHFSTCISSVVSGFIEPRIGRYSLFIFACTMHISTCIMMMFWFSYPINLAYIIFVLWGLGSGTILAQSHALMGELFPTKVEPAMAVYLMFRSLGHILGFGYAHFMCMDIKIYITAGVCLFSTALLTVFYKTNCLKQEKSTDWRVKI